MMLVILVAVNLLIAKTQAQYLALQIYSPNRHISVILSINHAYLTVSFHSCLGAALCIKNSCIKKRISNAYL